jgi:hypothetical protein
VLKRLAQETGLHIVTNTGYYGGANDRFVPKHAYNETADQVAARGNRGVSSDKILPLFSEQAIQQRLFLLGRDPIDPHRFGVLKVLKLALKIRFSLLLDKAPGRCGRELAFLKGLPILSPGFHLLRRMGCFAGLEEALRQAFRWRKTLLYRIFSCSIPLPGGNTVFKTPAPPARSHIRAR